MTASNSNQTNGKQVILIGSVMADGEPVSDVAVKFKDRPCYISDLDGKFEYLASDQGFTIEKIDRDGYKLLSPQLPFKVQGNESPITILMKHDEGFFQRRLRKKAEDLHEKALQLEKENKLKEAAKLFMERADLDPNNVRWQFEVGQFMYKYQDYKTAQTYYNRAIKKAEELYGEKNQWLAQCYDAYGDNYFKWNVYFESGMGDKNNVLHFADAKQYYQQAGHFWYTLLGEQNDHTAWVYCNMAQCYVKLDNDQSAMHCVEKALSVVDSGNVSPGMKAKVYHSVGDSFHGLGEDEKSLHYLEMAYQINLSLYGENSQQVFWDYGSLITTLHALGRLDETMATIQKLLLCTKVLYGEQHKVYKWVEDQMLRLKNEMEG